MILTDDPLRDFDRYQMEQYLWEQSRPICHDCGEHITGEYLWEFDGNYYCESCVRERRQDVDDF